MPFIYSRKPTYSVCAFIVETRQTAKALLCGEKKKKKEIMEIAVKNLFMGLDPKIVSDSHQTVNAIFPNLTCSRRRRILCASTHQLVLANFAGHLYKGSSHKCFPSISAVLSGAKDVEVSSPQFEDFSVATSSGNTEPGELKISIEVSGTKTRTIFDQVFDKMVDQAQPIPGFRRVKGATYPDLCGELSENTMHKFRGVSQGTKAPGHPLIPKGVLLEILGPSRVFKQVIKKVINSTVAEYIEKEGLKVSKDLRIEQSFEDLESTFEAGEQFNFDAVLQLQEMD
ncbi:Trigger factor, ribosome-binding, bacterial [Parasponia andersonii]|uniref:Trigger factor, ribosome-binding, bacterial n=1 Tax=Parasponia andersonii TaxID=3476 RepID=A0A2P5DWL4_PARAD|nr:Trigger factor, ribosome-binding, bacterial [Parasponia andersonii]